MSKKISSEEILNAFARIRELEAALADKDAALGAADKALKNCESPVAASCSDSVRHVLEMIDNARALIAAALKAEEVKK